MFSLKSHCFLFIDEYSILKYVRSTIEKMMFSYTNYFTIVLSWNTKEKEMDAWIFFVYHITSIKFYGSGEFGVVKYWTIVQLY